MRVGIVIPVREPLTHAILSGTPQGLASGFAARVPRVGSNPTRCGRNIGACGLVRTPVVPGRLGGSADV